MGNKIKNNEIISLRKNTKKDYVENITHKIIFNNNNELTEKFTELYKSNPYHARVKFYNNAENYGYHEVILFEQGNGDFQFVMFWTKIGISKTNRIYKRKRKLERIIYRSGKFWFVSCDKRVTPLTYELLESFKYIIKKDNTLDIDAYEFIKDYFNKRFYWFSFLGEYPTAYNLSFTKINNLKVEGINGLKKIIYKVPIRIANIVEDNFYKNTAIYNGDKIKIWNEVLKVLDKVECLRADMINSEYFIDSCKMAKTLGRKINCNWSLKRLKLEHDKWSKEISNILLSTVEERELKIGDIFKEFAKYSGYELLTTNKQLFREGLLKSHCVGTYVDVVERGSHAIYVVNGYTLELSVRRIYDGKINNYHTSFLTTEDLIEGRDYYLVINQFRGYKNVNADYESYNDVNTKLCSFYKEYDINSLIISGEEEDMELNLDTFLR